MSETARLLFTAGLLSMVAPRWFVAINATYDVCIAALCYWARRR